jgi:hypothetical protein
MKITQLDYMLKVEHEHGDDPIRKEAAFWFRLRSALQRQGKTVKRYKPSQHHITTITRALLDANANTVIFDELYQVRNLLDAYQKTGVVYLTLERLADAKKKKASV